jgi:hypothetical protein
MLTGICQGFEVLATLASGDKPELLRHLEYEDVNRKVYWSFNSTDDIKSNSRLFANFEDNLLQVMADTEHAFHYHTLGVSVSDFNSIAPLNQFFKVLSTDRTIEG